MTIDLMPSIMLKLSDIEPNKGQIDGLPKNPRFIKDDKFKKLVKSIEDNPEMTAMREILVYPMPNGKYVIIGGNMRYRAMKELKYKEAPCKVIPQEATTEQLKAYTLKDNSGYGEWDFDLLNNEWDLSMLEDCAIDLPEIGAEALADEAEPQEAKEDDFDETKDDIPARVQKGEVWKLGEHRLMCGDSTDEGCVKTLMGGGVSGYGVY
jgi:ParB-like chromosome segregation protein Spo0J